MREGGANSLVLKVSVLVLVLFVADQAFSQAQRGTLVHEETIRVSPSADTAKLGTAARGHELHHHRHQP